MLATLQRLGVVPSFSRPGVSNDNPYSEPLFRTLKYRPEYPSRPFKNPCRWTRQTRNWEPIETVCLNPERKRSPEEDLCSEAT